MPSAPQSIPKISCIVPAHNEGPRIGGVLDALVRHKLIDEIIVVNDGSTDNTLEVLQSRSGIRLINVEKNVGKTGVLKIGFLAAHNDILMTIDSDLVGLTADNITDLAMPVLEGRADVTMSLRGNSLLIFKILGIDYVSGERVFNRKLLGNLDDLDLLFGFAFESYMNKIIVSKKLRIKVVRWNNVISPRKFVKFSHKEGKKRDAEMVRAIVKYLSLKGLLHQYYRMFWQKV